MTDEPTYLEQAQQILAGTTMRQVEKAHLEAIVEAYECRIIKLCNMLEVAKREVLNG